TLPADAADRANALYETIDDEALPSVSISTVPVLCIAGLLAVGIATAHAADTVGAQRAFDAGVAAYTHHEFGAAREAFIASALADPTAPDAWANLGTAAWAMSDTARSVAAWQRALRMEPLASDVRERVELAHSLPWDSAGYVPPIPATWVFNLAAAL